MRATQHDHTTRPTPTITVLHTDTPPAELTRLTLLGHVHTATPDELPNTLPRSEILYLWEYSSAALQQNWPHARKLRWIHTASAGVDQLLFDELANSDIPLTNSRGVFDQPIAEYVLTCVLAMAKHLPTTIRNQDQHTWRHRETEHVTGRRALIVGTGPIGRAIARQLTAIGMHVTGIGRRSREHDPELNTVHPATELAHHATNCDYLILAAPLTPHTTGLVNTTVLANLPRHARLINIGRGALVNEPDLVNALHNEQLAGAALDVFNTEPLPTDSPLWTMPNVLISPHMAGDAHGWQNQLIDLFADNLQRWRERLPLHNVVHKQRGYVTDEPDNT